LYQAVYGVHAPNNKINTSVHTYYILNFILKLMIPNIRTMLIA